MNIWEGIRMAASALRGNKLRSLLTALGIIIGVSAVIAMISVGQGATKSVADSISSMGSNLIIVTPLRGVSLTAEDAEELLERVPSIVKALPSVSAGITAKYGSKTYDTSMEGTTQDYPEVRASTISSGRFITKQDLDLRANVAVVGQTIVTELFSGQSPLGKTLSIRGQSFTVIGVLAKKGASMGRDADDIVLVPLTSYQRLLGSKNISTLNLQARSAEEAPLAVNHVTAVFKKIHRREDSVRVMSQDELLETVNSATQTMTIMLGAIAGISLLVGGIGIMNIMLVSVTERTREIGIRKAVGAKRRNIMFQFIIESVFLSVGGGLLGIILGMGIAGVISVLGGWTTVLSPVSILVSFLFSVSIGLFFGIYPAYKAANLDPIVALRHE